MEILLREHEIEDYLLKSVHEYEEFQILENDDETTRIEKNKIKCDVTSKEVWSTLQATFERKGVASRMFLRRKLLTLKMKEGHNLH